jgi:DNA-binding CsgD family transcriptional regulator
MKHNQTLVSCYEDFMELCSSFRLLDRKHNLDEFLKFVHAGIFNQVPFGSSLIDYSSGKYLYMSNNTEEILSYSKEDYMFGLEFQYNNLLTEDRKIFNLHIFPDILQFLSTIPVNEYKLYRFSFNYRFYRKDGCIMKLLQHSTYLDPSPCGRPLLNRVIYSDITHFKNDGQMSLTISYQSKGRGFIPVFKKRYNPQPETNISRRELEVLKLCLQGLSSKLIADKLFLSVHTVKNHKRNMMEKTASKNISEVISYAIDKKLFQ